MQPLGLSSLTSHQILQHSKMKISQTLLCSRVHPPPSPPSSSRVWCVPSRLPHCGCSQCFLWACTPCPPFKVQLELHYVHTETDLRTDFLKWDERIKHHFSLKKKSWKYLSSDAGRLNGFPQLPSVVLRQGLCSWGWLETHYVAQTLPNLKEIFLYLPLRG